LILRNVTETDVHLIRQKLPNFKFPVPLMDTLLFKRAVEDKDGNFLGIGAIKLVGDVYLLFPDEVDPIKKAKAIKMLFSTGLQLSSQFGLNEWHAFIEDDKWAVQIKKHYGFKDIDSKYKLSLML
jgi:hypothetical protein